MKPPKTKQARQSEVPAGGVAGFRDFRQLALWMAASLAGMVTTMMVARGPFFRAVQRRLGGKRTPARRPGREHSLPMLAEAIVGNSKRAIAAVFGPPKGAVIDGDVPAGNTEVALWQAQMWYYPLVRDERLAMAIVFDDGWARGVEFFQAPNGDGGKVGGKRQKAEG